MTPSHPGEQGRPAEPEEGLGRDVLGHGRLQLGRDLRHFPKLDEVEIVQQADPHDAEHQVHEAQHRLNEGRVDPASVMHVTAHHNQRDDRAQDHRIPQVGQESRDKFRHFPAL
jgi:hypothetical protein